MKKFLQIFAVLFAMSIFAQNVSDFKYVMIPGTFKDVKTNRYDLNATLELKLKQKKYNVLFENQKSWPKDAVENPCSVLKAELVDPSNMFKNKILVQFFDCNGKEISSLEGKSSIKEFEPGMRDALENAAKNLAISNPVEQKISTQTVTTSTIEKTETIAEPKPTQVLVSQNSSTENSNKSADKTEVYSNGTLSLNKIFLGDGEFILVNPQSSVPFATFKPTSKSDTFRVKLSDGSQTIGYFENGKLIVEMPLSNGNFKNEVFDRK